MVTILHCHHKRWSYTSCGDSVVWLMGGELRDVKSVQEIALPHWQILKLVNPFAQIPNLETLTHFAVFYFEAL